MSIMKTCMLAAFAATTSAHMIITSPQPFANSVKAANGNLNNSPLADDGSNYPCKMSGGYTADHSTEYPLGSNQLLAFQGSAVHGGGSCQISITYDEAPNKQSIFKVIHSIEGGCPARNQVGNFPEDPLLQTPDTYDFTVPSDIPTGKAVLAWTWFNRVGQREMYMNCAPITITGSGGDISNFNALPDIMVANIGEKKCLVAEGNDVLFPNPGASVAQFPLGTFQDVSGQDACSFNWMAGSGQGSAQPPAGGSDSGNGAGNDAPPASSVAPVPATTTLPGNVFVTTGPADVAPTTTKVVDVQPTATASPGNGNGNGAGAGAGSGSGGSSGAPCSNEGAFYCTGTGFQQCASGTWSVVRPMAAGTQCTPGEGMSLNIFASKKAKRAMKFRA